MLREFHTWLVEKLEAVSSDTERFLLFVAWLNTVLERRGCRLIVTGGFAVEIYTGAAYRTLDIDLVVEGVGCAEILERFLKTVADRGLRIYIPRLRSLMSKGIDIVGAVYARKKSPVLVEVLIDGRKLRLWLEPPEELVVRYLAGWKFWNSSEDRDKVFALLNALWNKMDRRYLEERAREENVYDKLVEAMKVLGLG